MICTPTTREQTRFYNSNKLYGIFRMLATISLYGIVVKSSLSVRHLSGRWIGSISCGHMISCLLHVTCENMTIFYHIAPIVILNSTSAQFSRDEDWESQMRKPNSRHVHVTKGSGSMMARVRKS